MVDLISRSYILNIIEMWMKVPSYSESERNIMRAIDYEVRTAPSEEPKKGKWILEPTERAYKCSCCGCRYSWPFPPMKYCGECGAKMEVTE